jgi:hypothetical protein
MEPRGFQMTLTWQPSLFDQRADSGSVPEFRRFRETVDHIDDKRNAALIKTLYLGAYRINEILTKINAYDEYYGMGRAYGNAFRVQIKDFKTQDDKTVKVLLLTSAVAKRTKVKDGKEYLTFKQVALPIVPQSYEPWATDLLLYAKAQKDKAVAKAKKLLAESQLKDPKFMHQLEQECFERSLRFHLTKCAVEYIVRKHLGDLMPQKDRHNLKNPWRHWRLTHLRQLYGFDGFNLTAFAGWTFQSSMQGEGASNMLDVYLHSDWKEYFPKLCVPLSDLM